ncbi:hypothetical protein CF328_g3027 [Tilletia controversa]|nr:hypothetical protein CF328_g3027 [Tilletia controversa]
MDDHQQAHLAIQPAPPSSSGDTTSANAPPDSAAMSSGGPGSPSHAPSSNFGNVISSAAAAADKVLFSCKLPANKPRFNAEKRERAAQYTAARAVTSAGPPGFARGTCVRVVGTNGERSTARIEDVQVGMHLIDEHDLKTAVIHVDSMTGRQPQPALKLSYGTWHGRPNFDQHIGCTPAQKIKLAAPGTNVHISSDSSNIHLVQWITRCDGRTTTSGLRAEAAQLKDEASSIESPTNQTAISRTQARALRLLYPTRETKLHALRVHSGSAAHRKPQWTDRTGLRTFTGPSLGDHQDDDDDSYDPDNESVKSGACSEAASSELDASDQVERRLEGLRPLFDVETHCEYGGCGGYKEHGRRFPSREDAEFVAQILQTQHAWLLDSDAIGPLEQFVLPAGWLEFSCMRGKPVTAPRIMQCPLDRGPTAQNSLSVSDLQFDPNLGFDTDLPMPPKLAGLWMGDGISQRPSIIVSSTDEPTVTFMERCVPWFNHRTPEGSEPVRLRTFVAKEAGSYFPSIASYASHDVLHLSIRPSINAKGPKVSAFRNALTELGMLNNKAGGIPDLIMNGSLSDRLAFLAGFIESDGCYDTKARTYILKQNGEDHRKMIEDAKQMAESCGIGATKILVRSSQFTNHETGKTGPKTNIYYFSLTYGLERLQPYIAFERKRADFSRAKRNPNYQTTWKLTSDGTYLDDYVSVVVQGHNFQLHDRTVVHDSS